MSSPERPDDEPGPASVRVLLADDDPDQRLAVRALLRQRGFADVTDAVDGEDAVRAARQQPPHLILLDLAMPVRSGAEVLPELRDAAPDAAIVVLSNLPRRRLLETVVQRGAVGFVEKSVAPERLVDEILVAAALTDLARVHVLTLVAQPSAAGVARRFARSRLGDDDRDLLHDVELLVSELITNAILHTGSEPQLEIQMRRGGLRVEVFDDDDTLPAPRRADDGGPGGRGLHLVDTIASRWGAEPTPGGGKVVWFEIDGSRHRS